MNKKTKLALGTALTCGVIATFGSAFALYKNAEEPIKIGIGSVSGHTDSKDNVTYKIGEITAYQNDYTGDSTKDVTVELADKKLSPDLNKIVLKAPLSFEYDSSFNGSKQDYAVGRVSVTVKIDSKIIEKGVSVTANLGGYSKNGNSDTYFTLNKINNFFTKATFSSTSTEITNYIDTAIDASNIYCLVTIDMSTALSADNFLALSEIDEAFKVDFNWSPYSETMTNFEADLKPTAYIVGDATDWQTNYGDYQMVPNINKPSSKVEWTYKLLKGFKEIKVYDSQETVFTNHWVSCRGTDADGVSQTTDGNAKFTDPSAGYEIYYVRNGDKAKVDKGFWVSPSDSANKVTGQDFDV